MPAHVKPVYLLADSELLYWKQGDALFLESIRKLLSGESPKAAYIGASNGDVPDYFMIFEDAMAQVGITDCRMIRSSWSKQDASFLEQADLILLAGGDVKDGWRTIEETGMQEAIVKRYCEGAVVIGTSAGAVQLGTFGYKEYGPAVCELFETMRLVPFMVDVHDECNCWSRLTENIDRLDQDAMAVGIPRGCGLIVHPDGDVEPVRSHVDLFVARNGRLRQEVLVPSELSPDTTSWPVSLPAPEGLGKVSLTQFSGYSAPFADFPRGRCA